MIINGMTDEEWRKERSERIRKLLEESIKPKKRLDDFRYGDDEDEQKEPLDGYYNDY